MRLAKESDDVRRLWFLCFGSKDGEYFTEEYLPATTLVEEQDGKIIAMLHILDRTLRSANFSINAKYFLGIATHPDYRNKGIAGKLIKKALEKNPVAFLVPANTELVKFYDKFGFHQTNQYVSDKKLYTDENPQDPCVFGLD